MRARGGTSSLLRRGVSVKVDHTKYFPTLGAQARFRQALRRRGCVGRYSVGGSPHLCLPAKKARSPKLGFQLPPAARGERQTPPESNLFHLLACPKYPIPGWDGSLSLKQLKRAQRIGSGWTPSGIWTSLKLNLPPRVQLRQEKEYRLL